MTGSSKAKKEARKKSHSRWSSISDRSDRIAENRRTSHPVLQLQRQVGNSAVTQAIQRTQDSQPESNQVRIQREDDDSIWDSIMSETAQVYRGAGQFVSGDYRGLAETVGVADTMDAM